MNVTKHPLSHYVDLLKQGKPFSFARYGDGEWLTILGYYGKRNSNGCSFTKALSNDLRRVLQNNHPYDHAILKIAKHNQGEEIDRFIEQYKVKVEWVDGDIILNANLRSQLLPLMEQIRKRRVLYVGNMRLRELNKAGFFDYAAYVEPPPQNAYNEKARILKEVMEAIEKHDINFIGWSSGLAAKVFIDYVWEQTNGRMTQLDFGSCFDGYFKPMPNVNPAGSRSYIRKGTCDWEKLRKANTGSKL